MSLAAPYQEHYYIADGEMVTFPFGQDFQALSANYIKCVIYFNDGTSCIPTFTVDMANQRITIVTLTKPDGTVLTVPPAGSVVRVYRDTPEQQNVTASQLQNYTAKQLEKIFDSIVAMQQETSYSDLHKTIRLTEPQRDMSISQLTEEQDKCLLYWDAEEQKIKATEYGQDEVINQINRANTVADEAKAIAGTARDDLQAHKLDKNNPHDTSIAKLTDTEIVDPERFQFLSYDGTKWKNVNYSATYTWGGIGGNITDQTDLFDTFVKKTGDTVSGMYKHSYGSRTRYLSANNTNKYMDVYMNDDIFTLYYHYTNSSTATLSMRSYVNGHFNIYPSVDKGGTIGFPSRRFEKIYTTHLCGSTNGNNYLIVPDVGQADTLAVLGDIAFKSTDVELTSPSSGQFLMYDGNKWINNTQGYANTDLSNLTATGKEISNWMSDSSKNISNWSSNVTNCITEIPQDIKLELNAGTLTLKAGSKVYVPDGFADGSPIYNEIIIENDLSLGNGRVNNATNMIFVKNGALTSWGWSQLFSGTTAPSTSGVWFDTLNNVIKYSTDGGSTWQTDKISLPLGYGYANNSYVFTSIDQVFNGFGYIGMTVFALPGVKGLIPNGRNTDGSLKNIEIVIDNVQTANIDSNWLNQQWYLTSDGDITWYPGQAGEVYYDERRNVYIDTRQTSGQSSYCHFADTNALSGKIKSFTPKTVFHALDYNDSEHIANCAMPSSRYIDLIFSHGASYVAPADGYFILCGYNSTSTLANVGGIINSTTGLGCATVPTNIEASKSIWSMPAKKGETVNMFLYNGTVSICRFVYAQGAQ